MERGDSRGDATAGMQVQPTGTINYCLSWECFWAWHVITILRTLHIIVHMQGAVCKLKMLGVYQMQNT
jgi:hypothetical protein